MSDTNDLYPEALRRPVDGDRDAEIALLRRNLVVKKLTLGLALLTLVVVLAGGGWLAVRTNTAVTAIRNTQKSNTPISQDTHTLVAQQKDCLQPTGTCYQHNQARLIQVLGSVRASNIQVTAAGASCAVTLNQQGIPITFKPMYHCLVLTLHQTRKTQ